MKVRITTGEHVLHADWEDNKTARAIAQKMPFTVEMENLYDREMCYHFGRNVIPAAATRRDGYQVGDLIFWPPMGSLVILYEQNGERFERVQLGHTEDNVSFFANGQDARVTFELE